MDISEDKIKCKKRVNDVFFETNHKKKESGSGTRENMCVPIFH